MSKSLKLRLSFLLAVTLLPLTTLFAQSKFEQMGLSFTVPIGWEIGDLEKSEGSVYFSCEEKGGQGDQVAAFSIINADTDLEEYVQSTMDDYEKSLTESGAKITWGSAVVTGTIGDSYETRQATFNVVDESGPQDGIIVAFKACDNTVLLILSGPKSQSNDAAFGTITDSILCE